MGTVGDFINMVNTHGSPVTYHRENFIQQCPCLTAEGFRDPNWHIQFPPGSSAPYLDPAAWSPEWQTLFVWALTTLQPTPTEFAIAFYAWVDSGDGGAMQIFTYEYPTTAASPEEAYNELVGPLLSTSGVISARGADVAYLGWLPSALGGRIWMFTSAPGVEISGADASVVRRDAATGTWTYDSLGPITNAGREPVICNEAGQLPNPVELLVKAFVQPAQSTRLTRLQDEYLSQLFADIQSDDHVGIFPCDWNGQALNFRDWSQTGAEYVIYNNRKFLCVNANLIPAPDNGNPNHHWEVALRLIL